MKLRDMQMKLETHENKHLWLQNWHPKVDISDVDAELFNELSSSSVMRVDASIRRPPAVAAQVRVEIC